MNNYEALGSAIVHFYTRNGFGKVLKSEIDNEVFHCMLLETLEKDFLAEGFIDYYKINKSEIHRLSLVLRISEARFKTLLEADFFNHGTKVSLEKHLLNLVNSTTLRRGALKAGKIQFLLPNPLMRKDLEQKIASLGGIPDYSFNREILVLEIKDFLKLVHVFKDEEMAELIKANILKKSGLEENDPRLAEFFKDLNKIPVEDRLKKIALGLGEKFLGQAGDEIVGAVLDYIKTGQKPSL